jgi:hypothetical protein
MNPKARSLLRVAAMVALGVMRGSPTWAETTVPLDIQVDLLSKVVRFERGFVERAGAEVHVLVVDIPSNSGSKQAAKQLALALGHTEVAGKKMKVIPHHYTSPDALKKKVESERAQIVFLTPGFEAHVKGIASSFEGVHVITVSTDGDQVQAGVVLGFEVVSSRPKIAINLVQAKRQNLDFNSDLFRLARVFK